MHRVLHKIQAQGNDFLILINQEKLKTENIIQLAHRNFGIGFDQLFTINLSPQNNIATCKIYNSDGKTASLCINGLYAVANFLWEKYNKKIILTLDKKQFYMEVNDKKQVFLEIPKKLLSKDIQNVNINLSTEIISGYIIDIGNKHFIIKINTDHKKYPLLKIGKKLQSHKLFPNGINVSIYNKDHISNTIYMRTYERGCGLTYSCGSAALATCIIQQNIENNSFYKTKIIQPGGEIILTNSHKKNETAIMKGQYQYIGKIEINLENLKKKQFPALPLN